MTVTAPCCVVRLLACFLATSRSLRTAHLALRIIQPLRPLLKRFPIRMFCALLISRCVACSTLPTADERFQAADTLAVKAGWAYSALQVGHFRLAVWQPAHRSPDKRLTVYLEGDGMAWVTTSTPSADPTPVDPIALKLALAQPEGNVAYLGRPCQYVDAERSGCDSRYWKQARFAEDVVAASDQAIEMLKRSHQAQQITLVGFSGGATVAALVAARRTDVDRLVTVAGNLDPHAWTQSKGLAPLTGSLSPVDYLEKLSSIAQWHFAGALDSVIPPSLTQGFIDRFPSGQRPILWVNPEFQHNCCWANSWPMLWQRIVFDRRDQ